MDAFELIIGQLIVEEKYWVKHSVKIDLTPDEKRSINKPSTPRPEINIVAYNTNIDTIILLTFKKMTGAIISQFYWKDANNQYSRYFIGGSFFFIEPDLGVTTYSNLAMARSQSDMVYAEDYFYFDTPLTFFKSSVREGKGKQCIRLDREWLQEFPDKNVTLIKFPFPVSSEYFTHNRNSPNEGQLVIFEGYGEADHISVQDDPESIDFIRVDDNQIRKFKLFRQMGNIESIEQEPIYSDPLNIDNLDVLYLRLREHGHG